VIGVDLREHVAGARGRPLVVGDDDLGLFAVAVVAGMTAGVTGLLRPSCRFRRWLPAGEGGSVTTEGEHGEGDEGGRGMESECHPGDDADLGVDRFDQAVAELVLDRGFYSGAVSSDLLAEPDELGDAASGGAVARQNAVRQEPAPSRRAERARRAELEMEAGQ
jgi:hypothetical protein